MSIGVGSSIWTCTTELRYAPKSIPVGNGDSVIKPVLQQMWISDTGKWDWRDVPVVE